MKELLVETNGFDLRLHLDQTPEKMLIDYMIWPFDRIIADNITFRTKSQITGVNIPFDGLLFFSDAGNVGFFGFAIWNYVNRIDLIYHWYHEDDRRALAYFIP